MSLHIELTPEAEARLHSQAEALGLSVTAYLTKLLEEPPVHGVRLPQSSLSPAERAHAFREWARSHPPCLLRGFPG